MYVMHTRCTVYGVRRVSCAWEGAGGGGRDVYVLQSIASTYVQRADHRRCSEIEIEIAGVDGRFVHGVV